LSNRLAQVELPEEERERPKDAVKKVPKGIPHFSESFWTSLGHLSDFRIAWNFLPLVGWSQTIGLSREEKSCIFGISWRFYISRFISRILK